MKITPSYRAKHEPLTEKEDREAAEAKVAVAAARRQAELDAQKLRGHIDLAIGEHGNAA